MDADDTKKSVGEQGERRCGESRDRANQIGTEAVDKAQGHTDTDLPQEAVEKRWE